MSNEQSGRFSKMDPVWRNLPLELVYKICNLLTKVRYLPVSLSDDIKFQEQKLLWFYRQSVITFNETAWLYVFNCITTYIDINNLPIPYYTFYELGYDWNPQEETYIAWSVLTPDEREDLLEFNI